MKSINSERSNTLSQIRRAISQLYEYRYIYGQPDASLSIVTNAELSRSQAWLASYLAKDRRIAYEWTTDFQVFHADDASKRLLGAVVS